MRTGRRKRIEREFLSLLSASVNAVTAEDDLVHERSSRPISRPRSNGDYRTDK